MCESSVRIDKLTLDHIYPVSKALKDYNKTQIKRVYTINDVQPLCKRCNCSKNNKILGQKTKNCLFQLKMPYFIPTSLEMRQRRRHYII